LRSSNRQKTLAYITTVLLATAAVIWMVRDVREDDPIIAATMLKYECMGCDHSFEMVMWREIEMKRNRGGVVCPKCQKVQDPDKARVFAGIFESSTARSKDSERPEIQSSLILRE